MQAWHRNKNKKDNLKSRSRLVLVLRSWIIMSVVIQTWRWLVTTSRLINNINNNIKYKIKITNHRSTLTEPCFVIGNVDGISETVPELANSGDWGAVSGGGNGGDADDSVIASHYVRLLGFFHSQQLCMRFIVRQIPRRVNAYKQILKTFTRITAIAVADDASVAVASAAVAVAVIGGNINASVAIDGDADIASRRSTDP